MSAIAMWLSLSLLMSSTNLRKQFLKMNVNRENNHSLDIRANNAVVNRWLKFSIRPLLKYSTYNYKTY